MEKLLSEWFSGHFSYTALAGCPKERNYTLHSIRGSRGCCNQIFTEKRSFGGDIWMHGSGMDPDRAQLRQQGGQTPV